MSLRRTQIQVVGLAVLMGAVVGAGCGGSGSDAGSGPGPASTAPVTVAHIAPRRSTTVPTSAPTARKHATTTTTSGAVAAPTTLPASDLAALQHDLDEAGSSLGGADAALSQTDPNQTAKSEGTTP